MAAAVSFQMIDVLQAVPALATEQLFQLCLTLQERILPEILPIDFQQVEGAQRRPVVVEAAVQSAEVGNPVLAKQALRSDCELAYADRKSTKTGGPVYDTDVRLGSKTEVSARPRDVCFTPQGRHQLSRLRRPFRAITGSQLISRSLVGAPFLAKASWLYKQDAREVHRS
jgi:hypothetical protein